MSIHTQRQILCEYGHKVYAHGLVAANDGNLSVRLDDKRILITPTLLSKGDLRPRDLVILDCEGKIIRGKAPSSEYRLHLAIYRQRSDVGAIIHTHPPYATAFAVSGMELRELFLPEMIVTIGKIPLVPYAPPSSQQLADAAAQYMIDYDVVLLQNHGLVAVGSNLSEAYARTERSEHCLQIYFLARLMGNVRQLTDDEIEELLNLYPVNPRIRNLIQER